MQNKLQPNQSTLNLKIIAQVNGPFIAHFGFEKVELDTSRLRMATLNQIQIKSLSIGRTGTVNRGDDALVIEASYECVVNKNGRAYQKYLAKRSYGGPLGINKIDGLESTIRNLTADLTKYLGWRKGIRIHYDEIDKIDVRWQWEMDGESGDHTTDGPKYELLELYAATYSDTLHISPVDFEEFYSLQEEPEPKAIPLYQELMMEVDRLISLNLVQMQKNSRSAYLIMYVALEVATKSLVRFREPDRLMIINLRLIYTRCTMSSSMKT